VTAGATIIDAGGANLASVRYALERLGVEVRIARDADELAGSERIVLPGVGAAPPAMQQMRERGLDTALRASTVPLLGICLGMQLLFEDSDEGEVQCLGLLPGRVLRLQGSDDARTPHMGWNSIEALRPDPALAGVPTNAQAYFVHGFAAPVTADCVAVCSHGVRFAAVVRRERVLGTQFHPERSGALGARVLRNFVEGAPA
jgi:glutamine amidotransferase